MSKLLPVMKDFGYDYMQELAKESPDLVDLIILTIHSPEQQKKKVISELTDNIKKNFL
ncbi:hypothetical protein [Halalkalibacter krulwichiae]|uniref:hypothetical protein n=1 Tax=Halalkalibacter krulwichiae TaxID=199441 RepID=UPI001471BCD1|nr:hypothetical protein [Halalkalibacter krulwichiae]